MDRKEKKRFFKAKSLHTKIMREAERLPVKAEEFKYSTQEVATAILKTITEKKFVTDSQLQALENIFTGIRAWTKRHKVDK